MAQEKLQLIISAEDKASKEIKRLNTTLGKTKKALKAVKVASVAAFAAFGVGVGFAVKEFASFEKGMSAVKAITNATGKDFELLTNLAKEMGRTTVFTAKEAAEGMKFLGMAGFDTNEIMQSLQGTLNLAAAGNLDLGLAADISSNVLMGFNLSAEEMNRVVDVMAKTVTSANTDIIEMGEAMKFLAPTAAALKIPIEEASAVVGLLADAGLKGGIATRAFSGSLVRLADPTNKMMEGMGMLGLSVFNANGEFVGMASLLKQIEEGTKGMTDQQKQAAISMVFGTGSMKVMNSLLARGSEELIKFTKELEDSGGAANRMAKIQLDNLSGAFTLLKSAMSGAAIELGEKFAPAIRFVVELMTKFIGVENKLKFITDLVRQTFKKFTDFIENKTGIITVFKTAFEHIAIVFKELLLPELRKLWEALKPLMPFIKILAKVFGVLLLGALIAVAKIIEVTLIVGIKTLTIAIGIINKGITDFKETWDKITDVLAKVINKIDNLIDRFKKLNVVSRIKTGISSFLGFGGERAGGGIVQTGKSFLVGERGPELFAPGVSGRIIPNNRLGGRIININITGTFLSEDAAELMGDLLVNRLVGAGLNI